MKLHESFTRHAARTSARSLLCAALAASAATIASAQDGSVAAWGAGTTNPPGWPNFGQAMVPAGLATCTTITGGWMHSLAIRADGTVIGWGATTNNLGQATNQSIPPAGLGTCTAIAAGYYHSAVIRTNGTVVAWGDNRYNQTNVPATLGTCTRIAAGGYHTLVVRSNGTVAAWGAGTVYGGVIPDLGQCVVPVNLGTCTQVAGGGYHSVALRTDGLVVAWGANGNGQASVPATLGACTQIAAGDLHTVALRTDGTVVCWGAGMTAAVTPSDVGQSLVPAGLGPCTQIAAGGLHTIVVKADGSAAAWGSLTAATGTDPNFGQSVLPSSVTEPGSVIAVAGGGRHSLAITKTRNVPSQYTTIQAAINAALPGDRVIVAAGTYNQSFSLNGKNVVVRGAPNNATILDGTGLTTSIATFSGGEPATAGVENLFFRSGTAGQPINPPSYNFKGGGGIFGKDSSAFVKNCRFELCGADFGAGIYMLRCTMNIDGCVFHNNTASTDCGGAMGYACSGVTKNSTFTNNRCAVSYAGSGSAFKAVGIRTAGTEVVLEGCSITGNFMPGTGAIVEYYENVEILAGKMRIVGTTIANNITTPPGGAGGLRVIGTQGSCTLSGGTTICGNSPRNVEGAYLATGSWSVCDCLADLSRDGQVNGGDLGIVLSAWGTVTPYGNGDVNHDGLVNGLDLASLLSRWGPCQ